MSLAPLLLVLGTSPWSASATEEPLTTDPTRTAPSHDWWFPRFGPTWRLHEGTDIFADRGTPVRAPADGTPLVPAALISALD